MGTLGTKRLKVSAISRKVRVDEGNDTTILALR